MTQPELRLERTFAASPEVVWSAFTQAQHLAHWWGPAGCRIEVLSMDFQPQGHCHYAMRFPDGVMYGRFSYLDIRPAQNLVWSNAFADDQGNVISAPMPQAFPLQILLNYTFSQVGLHTRMLLLSTPLTDDAEELAGYVQLLPDMTRGFMATFDQLDAYLLLNYIKPTGH